VPCRVDFAEATVDQLEPVEDALRCKVTGRAPPFNGDPVAASCSPETTAPGSFGLKVHEEERREPAMGRARCPSEVPTGEAVADAEATPAGRMASIAADKSSERYFFTIWTP